MDLVYIITSFFASSVVLGKLFGFSNPRFLFSLDGENNMCPLEDVEGLNPRVQSTWEPVPS